ncbi:MAG: SAM-dependent methyltransferase [Bacteroidota bacterium]|nr:SAM-dependent methyltransferase [Bacteroidota bacterium]
MGYHRLIARISSLSLQCMAKVYHFMNAVMTGFWLGVMGDKSLDQADDLHYKRSSKYIDDSYNRSGLFRWEKVAIEKYFSKARAILLLAAGGGRETYALSKMGFEVDSYECNKALVEYGNQFLQRNVIKARIEYLPRDAVPAEVKKFDGVIVGWGAYTHIRGKKNRISFLEKLKSFLRNEAPLMVSFLYIEERTRQDRIVNKVSNFLKIFSKKGKRETGDWLQSGFVHYFTEEEIKNELIEAGYRVIGFNSVDYGCIVATI